MPDLARSAAYRISFISSAVFALAIGLLGIVLFWTMHLDFTAQLDATLHEEAATLAAEARADGQGELIDAIAQRETAGTRERLLYALFDAGGRRIAGHLQTGFPALGVHDLTFIDPLEGADSGRGLAVDLGGKRLLVAADRERLERIDRTVISVIASGFLLVLLLGAVGAVLLGGYLRRRLGAISSAAEAVVAGDLGVRMPVGSKGDEFDRLARSLNAMLARIETLVENLRQVSSDIAHDLRTPLARLRNRLEQGLAEPAGEGLALLTHDAIGRLDDVLKLFAAMLRIAEVESGELRRSFAVVDISALAAELAESYAPAIVDEGRRFRAEIEPAITVRGDRELLAQALINLLENAQSHTPRGSSIVLSARRTAGAVAIAVADNGPGVAQEDFGRITQRFARLEASRSTPGHGLGLNLVDAIVRLHGGQLRFEDNYPGLRAKIELGSETDRRSGGR